MPAIPCFFTLYVVFDRVTDMTRRRRVKVLRHSCSDFKRMVVELRMRAKALRHPCPDPKRMVVKLRRRLHPAG